MNACAIYNGLVSWMQARRHDDYFKTLPYTRGSRNVILFVFCSLLYAGCARTTNKIRCQHYRRTSHRVQWCKGVPTGKNTYKVYFYLVSAAVPRSQTICYLLDIRACFQMIWSDRKVAAAFPIFLYAHYTRRGERRTESEFDALTQQARH